MYIVAGEGSTGRYINIPRRGEDVEEGRGDRDLDSVLVRILCISMLIYVNMLMYNINIID